MKFLYHLFIFFSLHVLIFEVEASGKSSIRTDDSFEDVSDFCRLFEGFSVLLIILFDDGLDVIISNGVFEVLVSKGVFRGIISNGDLDVIISNGGFVLGGDLVCCTGWEGFIDIVGFRKMF
jgi:hypothetical protein